MATQEITIVRFKNLEPSWHVPRAKEPGFLRWLVNWVGGPEGYININRDAAAESDHIVVGYMWMPQGNRQAGFHTHSVAEIYIVLDGWIEGYDGTGQRHIASPLDCMYIPAGVPHTVRTYGNQDVSLIWVHDGLEKRGTAQYFDDHAVPPIAQGIQLVRFRDLEPYWDGVRAKEPGYLRWLTSWVGGPEGYVHFNRELGVVNDRISLGTMVLLPANKQVLHRHSMAEIYVVLRGKVVAPLDGQNVELGPLDTLYLPPGHDHAVRNHGEEPAYILWIHEVLQRQGAARYADPRPSA